MAKKNKNGEKLSKWDRMTEAEKEAFRKKMRKVMSEKFKDPVYRKKMRESKQTPKFRKLRSKIMSENHTDPEFQEKLRKNNYDNPDVRERRVAAFLKSWYSKSPSELEAFSQLKSIQTTEWLSDPENWVKMYAANWGNDDISRKRAASFSKTWSRKSPEEIIEFAKKIVGSSRRHANSHEKKLLGILKEHKFNYRFVGSGKVWVAGHVPDFVHRTHNLIIEYDGNYWHSREESFERDKKRNKDYRLRGYKLLILRTDDLKNESKLIEKIKKFEAKYKIPATRRHP